eukprot:CAMPEP_0172739740 /NCGR_PEP_ID=MMETSP1074-20121228/123217_1 /TAXON_ID=2916 /ORGANISM="Ceratium fusus, Strain PA161109" /LENGTH=44 /DNA_ID= /DNA_START= /DNA_END= /DNA_ORIENTATION=
MKRKSVTTSRPAGPVLAAVSAVPLLQAVVLSRRSSAAAARNSSV